MYYSAGIGFDSLVGSCKVVVGIESTLLACLSSSSL
jgi:hypothetical protein